MSDNLVTIAVYAQKRRHGTVGSNRSAGHAKSVVKVSYELGLGDSIIGKTIDGENSKVFKTEDETHATKRIATFENADPVTAALMLDNFEEAPDDRPYLERKAGYDEGKRRALAHFHVERVEDLPRVSQRDCKRMYAKYTFYKYNLQLVLLYTVDGEEVKRHSSMRPFLNVPSADRIREWYEAAKAEADHFHR